MCFVRGGRHSIHAGGRRKTTHQLPDKQDTPDTAHFVCMWCNFLDIHATSNVLGTGAARPVLFFSMHCSLTDPGLQTNPQQRDSPTASQPPFPIIRSPHSQDARPELLG